MSKCPDLIGRDSCGGKGYGKGKAYSQCAVILGSHGMSKAKTRISFYGTTSNVCECSQRRYELNQSTTFDLIDGCN